MKKISSFEIGKLRMAEDLGFQQRVEANLNKLTGEAEKTVVAAYKAAIVDFDDALKESQGSEQTAVMVEADALADTAWRAINAIAKVQLNNPSADVQAAASEVLAIWRKYGDVTMMPYDEEYGNLHNARQDFTELGTEKQALVHVDDWVAELATRCDEFIAARNARDTENSAKMQGIAKQTRAA